MKKYGIVTVVVTAGLLFSFPLAVASDARPAATIRVASLSIMPKKWDKHANANKIEKMTRDAAGQGASLVITPEGVLEGYVVNEVIREKDAGKKAELTRRFQELAEPLDGPYIERFCRLADELNIHLILGFLQRDGPRTYNSTALIGPQGAVIGTYRKTHFYQGYKVNPPGYTPGNDYPVFDIGRLKVGMMICFDRQLPEPARQLTLRGADLIVCPSYGGWGRWNTRLLQVRAYENQSFLVFTHPQQSLIIDRDGELLAESREDTIVIQELDLSRLEKTRQSVIHRRPGTYRNGLGQEDR